MTRLTTRMIDIGLDDHILPLVVPEDLAMGDPVTEDTQIPEETSEFGVDAEIHDDEAAALVALQAHSDSDTDDVWFVPVILRNGQVITNRVRFGTSCRTSVRLVDMRRDRTPLEVDERFVKVEAGENGFRKPELDPYAQMIIRA